MKIAVTMIPENGRISPVFETAEYLLTLRLCRNGNYSVIARNKLPETESAKIDFFHNTDFQMLICGAVCNETLKKLRDAGIRIVPFVSGKLDSVVRAAFDHAGSFPDDLIMPGCCRHHRKCCQIKEVTK